MTGTAVQGYLDGVSQSMTTAAGAVSSQPATCNIGKDGLGNGYWASQTST